MLSLVFYVPSNEKESVKEALFQAGAGKIGNYDCCCFEVAGTGQFRPLPGSHPSLGQLDQVEKVQEWRIEMVLEESAQEKVITALKKAHPYETPAYHLTKVFN